MTPTPSPSLSIIVPCNNEVDALPVFYAHMADIFLKLSLPVEFIFIDDGSTDDTVHAMKRIKDQHPLTQIVSFSRQFGKEAAILAGLKHASGDAVIPMDADLQDPPETILSFVTHWKSGYDVVIAQRQKRPFDSSLKRLTSSLFYWIHNCVSTVQLPNNVGDFRLIDRKVVDHLIALPENQLFMKGLFSWVGFKTKTILYVRQKRCTGKSSFNFWKLWNFALEGITSFSTVPLRIWFYIGLIIFFLSITYVSLIVVKKLFFGISVPGYASLFSAIMFFGSIQLISLGVLGEYIGRIYAETKQRPAFIIQEHVTWQKHEQVTCETQEHLIWKK